MRKASFSYDALRIVLGIWAALTLAFHMNVKAVAFRAARNQPMEIRREHGYLRPLSNKYAYLVENSELIPVRYEALPAPFSWLCGACILHGIVRETSTDRALFPGPVTREERQRAGDPLVGAGAARTLMHEECAVFHVACALLAFLFGVGAWWQRGVTRPRER